MDCEKCVANCSCKGHPMTVANCARFDDGRGKRPTETECLGMVLYEPPERTDDDDA